MTLTDKDRRIESAKRQAVAYRNYRRARDRALVRLAQDYPDEYKEYLEQEKANDENEGKKWVNISGRTNATNSTKSLARTRSAKPKRKASNQRKNQSNYGRKK